MRSKRLTQFANFFCAAILYSYLEGIEKFSGIQKVGIFKSHPFKKGFLIVFSYFILIGFGAIIAPTVSEAITKFNIYKTNNYIDDVNTQKQNLRNEREKESRSLSFADFSLDDSFTKTISTIENNGQYTLLEQSSIREDLYIHKENYISIVDTILSINSLWNNEIINIELFFVKDKLEAIRYSPNKTDADSIINIYSSKYGEPEYKLKKYIYWDEQSKVKFQIAEEELYEEDYEKDSFEYAYGRIDKENIHPETYYWTYKNSIIKIDYKIYSYYYDKATTTITYFSRNIEPVLKKKKLREEALQREKEKQYKDSIRRLQEIERQHQIEDEHRIMEQRRQEELNHKRSMEQI